MSDIALDAGAGDQVAVTGGRGTRAQRLRVGLLRIVAALATRCPTGLAGAGADAVGELWYRATPARAAVARANLRRICEHLAATCTGSAQARRAATDDATLERLVRAAYRHAARTYLELLRRPAVSRELWDRLTVEHPESIDPAFEHGAAILATMHFGSLQVVSEVLATISGTPVTSPMETLSDPEMQRFLAEQRTVGQVRLVSIANARRELRAALVRGELIGIVADRDISGGGIAVPLFGYPAPLPVGPAMLALEQDVALHVAATRRLAGERFAGHLVTILPAEAAAGATTRRARVEAVLGAEARAFEHFIAAAPEQWWAVFFPIWPDLAPEPRRRPGPGGRRSTSGRAI